MLLIIDRIDMGICKVYVLIVGIADQPIHFY